MVNVDALLATTTEVIIVGAVAVLSVTTIYVLAPFPLPTAIAEGMVTVVFPVPVVISMVTDPEATFGEKEVMSVTRALPTITVTDAVFTSLTIMHLL
jgi:hypothetical protein